MDQQDCTRLLTYLERVPDPRERRGKRYAWPFLWAIICFGLACGHKTTWAIAQWARMFCSDRIERKTDYIK
jgi:hypothetical protein